MATLEDKLLKQNVLLDHDDDDRRPEEAADGEESEPEEGGVQEAKRYVAGSGTIDLPRAHRVLGSESHTRRSSSVHFAYRPS